MQSAVVVVVVVVAVSAVASVPGFVTAPPTGWQPPIPDGDESVCGELEETAPGLAL